MPRKVRRHGRESKESSEENKLRGTEEREPEETLVVAFDHPASGCVGPSPGESRIAHLLVKAFLTSPESSCRHGSRRTSSTRASHVSVRGLWSRQYFEARRCYPVSRVWISHFVQKANPANCAV